MRSAKMSEKVTEEWLRLGSRITDLVNMVAEREDLMVSIYPGKVAPGTRDGQKSPSAWHIPAEASVNFDAAQVIDPKIHPDAIDLWDTRSQAENIKLMGALVHECAHAAHTHLNFAPGSIAAHVRWGVLLEESRIEKQLLVRRPQDRVFLRAAVINLVAGGDLNEIHDKSRGQMAHSAALILARVDNGVLEDSEVETLRNHVKQVFGEDGHDRLRNVWLKAQTLKDGDLEGLVACGKEYFDIINENDEQPQQGPGGQGQPEQSSDEQSSPSSGNSSPDSGQPESNQDSESESEDSNGSGEQQDGEESGKSKGQSSSGDGKSDDQDNSAEGSGAGKSDKEDKPENKDGQKGSEQGDKSDEDEASEDQSKSGKGKSDEDAESKDQGNSDEGEKSEGDDKPGEDKSDKGDSNSTKDEDKGKGDQDGEAFQMPCGSWTSGDVDDVRSWNRGGDDLPQDLLDEIQEILDEVAADAQAEIDIAASPGRRNRAKENREREQEKRAQKRNQSAAKKVFEGSGTALGRGSYLAPDVDIEPDDKDRRNANLLTKELRKARHRDVHRTTIPSMTPPGRMVISQAAARDAQRSRGEKITATPWRQNRRRMVDSPPLTVGLSADASGSMDAWQRAVSSFAWALGKAVQALEGKIAAVAWNDSVRVIARPNRVSKKVRIARCGGGSFGLADSLDALDGEIDLVNSEGVRVQVIITDGQIGNTPAIQDRIDRLNKAGVLVVWVQTPSRSYWGAPFAPKGVHLMKLKNPNEFGQQIGKFLADALTKHGQIGL